MNSNEISLEGAIAWLTALDQYPETLKYCKHALHILKADPYKEPRPEPLPFTDNEKCALTEAVDSALEDQKQYLQCGGGESDYGEEWADVAKVKSEHFQNMANAVRKFGAVQMAKDCAALAADFREHAGLCRCGAHGAGECVVCEIEARRDAS